MRPGVSNCPPETGARVTAQATPQPQRLQALTAKDPDKAQNADRGVPHFISVLLLLLMMGSMCACSVATSCPTLCNPMDYSPSGSSAHGILQARILEWVAMPFSRESS